MKRIISTTIAAAGLVLASLALAQPAQAITNPADNPRPITVKGDDGKTYTDGEDTLPGYDDEACTYIPGASFDFANNKVRYADGQSITWTEWDRATGYKEWKAKQDQPKPAPTTAKPTTPKPKPVKTTAPKPKATAKPKATTKPATSGTSTTKPSATPTPTATASAEPTDDTSDVDAASKPDADETAAAPADEATDGTGTTDETVAAEEETTDLEVERASSEQESGGTGSAGLLILGGLAGAGILAVAGYSAVARKRKGSTS
ncbi:MAG: hypothetical protein ABWX74_07995 [Aeromicrobium sp.]